MKKLLLIFILFMGCDKDPVSPENEPEPIICSEVTEIELWGEWYDIESTTEIYLYNQGLTGSIPPEIGCLTNLTNLNLYSNNSQRDSYRDM